MNDDLKERISKSFNEFIADIGPGQFTYWRWMEWLVDNEAGLVEDILAYALDRVLTERKDVHKESGQ